MLPDLDVILTQDPGATFFTADLHVHSHGFSHDVTDKGMSVVALIDAALARGVGVLSITDHNNDGQVLPSLEYSSKFSDRLMVIPGVEISTANGHLLVYCDPHTPELIGTRQALGSENYFAFQLNGEYSVKSLRTSRSGCGCIPQQ